MFAEVPVQGRLAEAAEPSGPLLVQVEQQLVGDVAPAFAGEDEPVEAGPQHLVAQREEHRISSGVLGFKIGPLPGAPMGFFQDVLDGTAAAPWVWWLLALILLVALLIGGLKLLGLFPE